jgi:predicted RNA-binding Zn ribbon-like protein
MDFQLVAGHPALDLVNTLDWRFGTRGPQELLTSYDDLLQFIRQSNLLAVSPPAIRNATRNASTRALKSCIELREGLAEIFYARLDRRPSSAATRHCLERYFKEARLRQSLNWAESPRLDWQWPVERQDAALPVWALALSASDLMTSDAVDRIRACDNPECRWLFLDTSKNHTRRWCDMKICGNRMKARRFKASKASTRPNPGQ